MSRGTSGGGTAVSAGSRTFPRWEASSQAILGARLAPVVVAELRVAARAQDDHRLAPQAPGRLVGRRVLERLEVLLVRPIVDIDLRLEVVSAPGTVLPGATVSVRVVVAAQREAPMVAVAAVPRVGEEHVGVLVVADPLPAAWGGRELGPLATETAPRPGDLRSDLPSAGPSCLAPFTRQQPPLRPTAYPPSGGSGRRRRMRDTVTRDHLIPTRPPRWIRPGQGRRPGRLRQRTSVIRSTPSRRPVTAVTMAQRCRARLRAGPGCRRTDRARRGSASCR